MASFRLGWEKRANVELDVYLSKDNRMVVIHDASTKRTAGVDLKVKEDHRRPVARAGRGVFQGEGVRRRAHPVSGRGGPSDPAEAEALHRDQVRQGDPAPTAAASRRKRQAVPGRHHRLRSGNRGRIQEADRRPHLLAQGNRQGQADQAMDSPRSQAGANGQGQRSRRPGRRLRRRHRGVRPCRPRVRPEALRLDGGRSARGASGWSSWAWTASPPTARTGSESS